VTLVPLAELLVKYGISRKTYHNMLNKGLLPRYAKRHGEPGKRGARYLYDAEAFEVAWRRHAERTMKGVGINVEERDKRNARIDAMPKFERINFILEDFPVLESESLTEYEARVAIRRGELEPKSDEELLGMVLDLFEQGLAPRAWK